MALSLTSDPTVNELLDSIIQGAKEAMELLENERDGTYGSDYTVLLDTLRECDDAVWNLA
jgi:hypothetical protein